MVPVENHVEQQINAQDAIKAGFGITDNSFNLDRLCELPEHLNNTVFRDWIHQAENIFLRAMDHAVKSRP